MSATNRRTIVYVSNADSGDISVLVLDPRSGALTELQRCTLGGLLMPLALDPDRSRLYVARRSAPFGLVSLAIGADGQLTLLGDTPLPASMAYVSTDRSGRYLFSASYDAHQIAVSPIGADGRVEPVIQVLATEPNAHAVQADASNRVVYATSLGGDVLLRYDFDAATGRLAPHAQPRLPVDLIGGRRAGPRHFAFHPSGAWLYLLNELDASISVFSHAPGRGADRPLQRVDTLPPGFETGAPWAAEIRITPDGRHLYSSERRSSTLAAFSIDAASGTLTRVGHQATETQPRGFAIDPSGRWLIAAGERSQRVSVHPIHAGSGALGPGVSTPVGERPNWVECIELH